jgi:nicotinamide phosphoribosyltransferase
VVDGVNVDVFKDPISDAGKKSKVGRLTLEAKEGGGYQTVVAGEGDAAKDVLVTVFENGELRSEVTFAEVRARAQVPQMTI